MTRDDLLRLIERPGAALLDGWSDEGRWTIALPEPLEEFRVEAGELPRLDEFLAARVDDRDPDERPDLPFAGGWVGFISYETGAAWEGARPREEAGIPAALFYRHEKVIEMGPDRDFEAGRSRIIRSLSDGNSALRASDSPSAPLANHPRPAQSPESGQGPGSISRCVDDSLLGDLYPKAHESIREGIARGDYYQVNLTRRFRTAMGGHRDAGDLFRELAGEPPPRYSVFLRGPGFDVLSASPELFVRADFRSGDIEMRPIKGTAPRYPDPSEDRAGAARLLASAKDRAENVMIVDLCRNDLGRVCESGSISVPHLCRLASHRVHHLESVIEGRLSPTATPADVFRATFPPGSVTGAPKRAAVAAIREIEPAARGVYTGAVGYFDRRGRMAFNVAIRTAVLTESAVEYHAGGGITWSSEAGAEDLESRLKAREFFEMIAAGKTR